MVLKLGVVEHTYNLSTWEAKQKSETCLGYSVRPCQK
jgi:hypothetical protein